MDTDTHKTLEKQILSKASKGNWVATLSNKNYLTFYLLVVVAICVGGIGYFGEVAHYDMKMMILHKGKPLTAQDLESGIVRPTQQLCYKFFALSMNAFLIQVLSGVACALTDGIG
eukprot:137118_1